jgi:RNA polymerase sigma factor (sigma-70 family)
MGASPANAPDAVDEVYRRCMGPLLERARAWFPTLRGTEQDLYQAAWSSLLGNSRPIRDVEKYLESAVYSAGLKELRRRRRRPVISLSTARLRNNGNGRTDWQEGSDALADRTALLPEEQLERVEDVRLLSELLDELTPLQREIVKLRWGCGVPRRDAAALLGITERSLKREMERAGPVISRNADLARSGKWCEVKRSLVVAYCLGLLGAGRAAKARKHLKHCAACRSMASEIHGRMDRLAAALPLPALAADSSSRGHFMRAAELGDSVHGGLSGFGTAVKPEVGFAAAAARSPRSPRASWLVEAPLTARSTACLRPCATSLASSRRTSTSMGGRQNPTRRRPPRRRRSQRPCRRPGQSRRRSLSKPTRLSNLKTRQ